MFGTTRRMGESPQVRPGSAQDVLATIYEHLEIDFRRITLPDLSGRPQYLIEEGRPIREFFA